MKQATFGATIRVDLPDDKNIMKLQWEIKDAIMTALDNAGLAFEGEEEEIVDIWIKS